MEAVCPDCGMCETHGNLHEIKKGAKDSNGYTSCWKGYHAAGTKKGKNGTVRNCVPNESQGVAEGRLHEFSINDRENSPGDDPYKYPKPKHYARSIDFFGQFEAEHFDKEDINDATGEFRGYWNYGGKLRQIAYFKFDDADHTDSDDPGMGWYYEPQNEGVAEGAKVDRQAMHITKSMMKAHPGMSHDQAEAAAWAHIKHPKKKKKKVAEGIGYGSKVQHPKYGSGQVIKVYPNGMITVNFSGYPDPVSKKPGVQSNFMPGDASYNSLRMEGWTTDTLAAQLFEQEITYEDKLNSMLTKKLSK
jgi:hypothetical protein